MSDTRTTLGDAWRAGHADGLEGRRDEARYTRNDADALLYRDGHRMARRELMDATSSTTSGCLPTSRPRITEDQSREEKLPNVMEHFDELDKMVTRHFSVPVDVFSPEKQPNPAPTPSAEPAPAPRSMDEAPSAFSDPIPGKKPKRAKAADPAQASLF